MAVSFPYDRKDADMATTPIQGFTRAVEAKAKVENPVVAFFLKTTEGVDENGEEIVYRYDEFHAMRPSEEQMMLLLANGLNSDATVADEAASIFRLLRDVLEPKEYKVLVERFRDPRDLGVSADVLGELFEWLMEQWSDFPTQQPGASSRSRGTTGARSTGRVRGKGSISSTSR